jgi:hypothetical protein
VPVSGCLDTYGRYFARFDGGEALNTARQELRLLEILAAIHSAHHHLICIQQISP